MFALFDRLLVGGVCVAVLGMAAGQQQAVADGSGEDQQQAERTVEPLEGAFARAPVAYRSYEVRAVWSFLTALEVRQREVATDLLVNAARSQPKDCLVWLVEQANGSDDPELRYRLILAIERIIAEEMYRGAGGALGARMELVEVGQGMGFRVLRLHPLVQQARERREQAMDRGRNIRRHVRGQQVVVRGNGEMREVREEEGNAAEAEQQQPAENENARLGDLRVGDTIVAVQGVGFGRNSAPMDMMGMIARYAPGTNLELDVLRNGTTISLSVELLDEAHMRRTHSSSSADSEEGGQQFAVPRTQRMEFDEFRAQVLRQAIESAGLGDDSSPGETPVDDASAGDEGVAAEGDGGE